MQRVAMVFAVALLVGACTSAPPPVGADGGPLETVPSTAAPSNAPDPPVAGPEGPGATEAPGPTANPSTPGGQPSDGPPDQSPPPDQQPDQPPGQQPAELPPVDLELDGWDLRVIGLVDPARADVLNQFLARPVVVVVHAQADPLDPGQAELPDPVPSVVADVEVELGLDDGSRLASVARPADATTVECPAEVERRVIVQAGQGQRLCVVFDVTAVAEVRDITVGAAGRSATVAAADAASMANAALGVGSPAGALELGESAEVQMATASGTAPVSMAVTEVGLVDQESGVLGVQVQLSASSPLEGVRLEPDAIAAIATDGTQRVRRVDVDVSGCRGTRVVDVPDGDGITVCVPIVAADGAITSHVRFASDQGAPTVWEVIVQGGEAGPGSNA